MQSAFATHMGQRRQNQDNGLLDSSLGLYAVADGVGGGDSGEVASASVCMSLYKQVVQGIDLEDAIHHSHQLLMRDHSGGERGYAASTIVAVRENGSHLHLSWVGDSRIYLLRNGELSQLSEDHSLVVQQSSRLTPEESYRMRHVLTQAVGAAGENGLQVDVRDVDRQQGDRWLLCSDGLHGVVSDAELLDFLKADGTVQEVANRLVQKALDNGADDNVTVVVLDDDEPVSDVARQGDVMNPVTDDIRRESVNTPQRPWHYMVLGGVLALLLFLAMIWGL
ncbi:serine/threonine protein phosphatase [Hahella sp. CCB-MM4]|uniref:PP2C family protein-serine/threonine phosphatase n=1 Tax=Hahella sp. (strain CCB-MM4) TaxID=1926491 RepID=UPI000B9BB3D5|nr:protein phosphatase 2C domain-containing protein [Hahella sp. CCB-MM4]OZG75367.1 serine/threonine protein phosphatase [Hahella sp. CCB-MM4]